MKIEKKPEPVNAAYTELKDSELSRVSGGMAILTCVPNCFYDRPVTEQNPFEAECPGSASVCPLRDQCFNPGKV